MLTSLIVCAAVYGVLAMGLGARRLAQRAARMRFGSSSTPPVGFIRSFS